MASSTQAHQPAGETTRQGCRPEIKSSNPDPSRQPLLARLYVSMLRCRMVTERVAQLAREGKLAADWVSDASLGVEAILAGVAMRLATRDVVAPCQRSFAAEVARGAPLDALFRRIRGAGPDDGETRPAFPPPVQVPEAGSAALALACAGRKDRVVVVFFDAAEAGLAGWRKAVLSAGARKLPILFVMENGRGNETPLFAAASRKKNGAPLGEVPRITVDGTDVVAVSRVARESLRCARASYGPTLMECTIGAALQTLPCARAGNPQTLDPIRATEERLARQGLWSEAWKREISERCRREMEEALAALIQVSPEPESV